MSITAAMQAGQATARSMMTDRCTIVRAGVAEPVYDTDTDTYTRPDDLTIYTGPCRVKTRKAMARTADAGEAVVVVARRELHLPVDEPGAGDVDVDDVATMDTSLNPMLVGKRLRISDLGDEQSHETARRLGIEQT